MARLSVANQAIQDLAEQLVPLFLAAGSVNRLSDLLNQALEEAGDARKGTLYPNRIHAVLSDDPARSLNEATVELLKAAVSKASIASDSERATQLQSDVLARWRTSTRSRAALREISEALSLPPAIVRHLLESSGELPKTDRLGTPAGISPPNSAKSAAIRATPDWSFQDEAVARTVAALTAAANAKIGAVLPTGAGKTRIALRVALQLLANGPENARVLWVTHRRTLKRQAHRELQKLLKQGGTGLSEQEAPLIAQRIDFVMVSEMATRLDNPTTPIACAIVDEGHHAAAAGYAPVFGTPYALRALLITATPNRTDGLPIGIDRIAYSITYRELAQRGVIVMPEFLDFPVDDFEWGPEDLQELAADIIQRAESNFLKTLVVAPRIDRVEEFYEALRDALAASPGHPLSLDDIGFIHSKSNSLAVDAEAFLDVFAEKPRAILISAQMLLEGFDDPSINAVVVTYPTQSVITMMQAAGRCLRHAPGKTKAYVMQATNPDLAYRFDQRWLYQDLSDQLRPELVDVRVGNAADREAHVLAVLEQHRVATDYRDVVIQAVRTLGPTDEVRLLLFGTPYFGARERFGMDAQWGALAMVGAAGDMFRRVFNDFSAVRADEPDAAVFLDRRAASYGVQPGTFLRRQLLEMLTAMHLAGRELWESASEEHVNASRPFRLHHSTTWLKYITVTVNADDDPALTAFLADCFNREAVVRALATSGQDFVRIVKLPIPLGPFEAHLLPRDADDELSRVLDNLRTELAALQPSQRSSAFATALAVRDMTLLPDRVWRSLDRLLIREEYDHHSLTLGSARFTGDTTGESHG